MLISIASSLAAKRNVSYIHIYHPQRAYRPVGDIQPLTYNYGLSHVMCKIHMCVVMYILSWLVWRPRRTNAFLFMMLCAACRGNRCCSEKRGLNPLTRSERGEPLPMSHMMTCSSLSSSTRTHTSVNNVCVIMCVCSRMCLYQGMCGFSHVVSERCKALAETHKKRLQTFSEIYSRAV